MGRKRSRRGAGGSLVAVLLYCAVFASCADLRAAGLAVDESGSAAATYGEVPAMRSLMSAIDERLAVMQDLAALKWVSGAAISDPAREAEVLDRTAAAAAALGLDPVTVRALFAEQIRLARELQVRFHDEWRTQGRCEPCASPVELAEARRRIDAANERQLRALQIALPGAGPEVVHDVVVQLAAALQNRYGFTDADRDALVAAVAGVARMPVSVSLQRIRATGKLRIGTTGDYAPFSLEQNGTLAGSDIELARELARHLGVQPVFVRTSWPTLLRDLQAGRFDVAMSGISYTEERAEAGALSVSYHEGGKTIVARCDELGKYDTLAEVDEPDVRVVVNPGGTNERFVREQLHEAHVMVHPDNRTVFDEIIAHRADVMITDDVEADLQAMQHRDVVCRAYPGTLTTGNKHILMARDPALRQAVDDWLQQALAAGIPQLRLQQAMQRFAQTSRQP